MLSVSLSSNDPILVPNLLSTVVDTHLKKTHWSWNVIINKMFFDKLLSFIDFPSFVSDLIQLTQERVFFVLGFIFLSLIKI